MAHSPQSPYVLTHWEPENPEFWGHTGKSIAARNLLISIFCLLLAFAVWMVWSVVVVNLPGVGFPYTTNQLFWLAALPGLSGATLRIFYAFMVPIFGGRRWTAISTGLLLLPALGIGLAVQNPDTPYWIMAMLATLCGLGGGNFASSMANISFFYPSREKGVALGLNAGLGNLGVSVVQLVIPLVITVGIFGAIGGEPLAWSNGMMRNLWLQNAGFIWVPFLVAATLLAWFRMNDIADVRASFREQSVIFRRKHTWIMCWLYLGTFGSFIGYSAGFPLLIASQFPTVNPVQFAFLGPLLGALVRPIGGWLSDQIGGARVTFWNFVIMALAAYGVIAFLPAGDGSGNFWAFFVLFMLLFLTTGIGNGSTFRMIPVIFLHERMGEAAGRGAVAEKQALVAANKEGAAVLGFSSAVAAYGAFFIPRGYGISIDFTGGPAGALWGFIVFYISCIAVTWWFYARRGAEVPC